MAQVDPQLGGFLFSNANVVLEDWEVTSPRDVEIATAALEESGASSQGKLAGRIVRFALDIRANTVADLRDNISALTLACSNEMPLDLHMESQFPGRYLLVKRHGDLAVRAVQGTDLRAKATVEFLANDPYWIAAQAVTQRVTLDATTKTTTIDLSIAGSANALWIPVICVLQVAGTTFASGKAIKIANTSTNPNEIFRYKASADLTAGSGKTGLFDGESKEVMWDGTLENKNFAGVFLRLRGSIANVIQIDLDTTGSNGLNSTLDFVYAPRWL